MFYDTFPRIFEVSLTNGTTRSAGVKSSTTFTGVSKPIMVQFGNSDTQVIISYPYNSGSNMIVWSTSNSSVVASYNTIAEATIVNSIVGSQSNGMLYFAYGSAIALKILKFYYYDPSVTSSQFSGAIAMDTQTSASIEIINSSLSSQESPTLSNATVTIGDISATEQSNNTRDIVYINGRDQFHSIASGYSGNISFEYFCSKTTTTSLTTSLYDVDSSYIYLTVSTAPTVTTDTNYSYGISYLSGDVNITSENTIGVYMCGISNCASCQYTTRDTACTTCDTGYTLSSGGSNCEEGLIEDETVEAIATTTKAVVGATVAVSAASSVSGASSASSGPSLWALINQYQLIILLPMLGTYLENDFEFYITEFELMSFDFDFMDFIKFPFIDSQVDGIDYQQPVKVFSKNGIESGSFIYNHYRFIKVILIVFICDMIFLSTKLLILKLIKPKHQCWTKIFDKGSGFFRFSVYLRSLIEVSLFI